MKDLLQPRLCVTVVCAQSSPSCLTLCDPMNCSSPGFSVCVILQARILEWVAISFCRGSSQPKGWTCISWVGSRVLYRWATKEAPSGSQSVNPEPKASISSGTLLEIQIPGPSPRPRNQKLWVLGIASVFFASPSGDLTQVQVCVVKTSVVHSIAPVLLSQWKESLMPSTWVLPTALSNSELLKPNSMCSGTLESRWGVSQRYWTPGSSFRSSASISSACDLGNTVLKVLQVIVICSQAWEPLK